MLRLAAFRYAWNGLSFFISHERHAPVHLIATLLVVILGLILNLFAWEWLAILICIGLVISTEIINSSIEQLTDMVSRERSEQARIVKDLAAAAVLVCSAIASITGLLIFVPKLYNLL